MSLLSVISFAANAASGCADAGLEIVIVPAPCALLYMSLEWLQLNLYILAKEVDPSRDSSGLVFWDGHDESTGLWGLV